MSFSEISMSYYSTLRCWTPEPETPTEPTGLLVHEKILLDKVQARLAPQLIKKNIHVIICKYAKITVLPHCTVWLMVY